MTLAQVSRTKLPQAPAPSSAPQTLRVGSQGPAVKDLQARLGMPAQEQDGIFGPRTRDAVTAYQQRHGLGLDGVAGPRTLEHLSRPSAAPANPQPAAAAPAPSTPARTPAPQTAQDATRNAQRASGQAAQSRVDTSALPQAAADAPLRVGATGPRVTQLQQLLDMGPAGQTGRFGNTTRDEVQKFQRTAGLEPDGVVGRQTMTALVHRQEDRALTAAVRDGNGVLRQGAQGPEVRALQRQLGMPEAQRTGTYDDATAAAVRQFQGRNQVVQNGMVGRTTLDALERTRDRPAAAGNGNVPLVDQHRMNTPYAYGYCGVAATAMAIANRTGRLPVDPGNASQVSAFGGRMYTPGQGSSGELMARTMRDHGVDARFRTNGTVDQAVRALDAGHVVPLGVTNLSGTVTQPASSARYGSLPAGHAHNKSFPGSGHWVAITGYEGPASNPTAFLVNDPDTGARLRMTREQLLRAAEGNGNMWMITP